jgi:hypothetical protein
MRMLGYGKVWVGILEMLTLSVCAWDYGSFLYTINPPDESVGFVL